MERILCVRIAVNLAAIVCAVVIALSGVAVPADLGSAGVQTLEQNLDILSQKGFPGPIVAILAVPYSEASEDKATSLEEAAQLSGLKLFRQDGVYVLGPAVRRDFAELFGLKTDEVKPKGIECVLLLDSLDDSQLQMIGSKSGLPFTALSPEQQALVKQLFAPGNIAMPLGPDGVEIPSRAMPAESLPLRSLSILASLETHAVTVHVKREDPPYGYHGGFDAVTEIPPANCWMLYPPSIFPDRQDALQFDWPWSIVPSPAQVANTLKQSDLDYSLASLNPGISLSGHVTLQGLIDDVAKSTGLKLYASPGSDKVPLYVSATGVPAGHLLKAVSLATTGTWRRFGDGYIFVFDLAGIGQIKLRARELAGRSNNYSSDACDEFQSFVARKGLLRSLPPSQWTLLSLESDEIDEITALGQRYHREYQPWSMLSDDHQELVDGLLALPKWVPKDTSLRVANLRMRIRIAFQFKGMPPLLLSQQVLDPQLTDMLPLGYGVLSDTVPGSSIGQDVRLPLLPAIRGCVWKPSRRENPADVVSLLKKHGFNVLYLKVFADGYTAFPSEQFPQINGLGQDYLRQIISLAHAESIKVLGLVDVLRWSDGRPGHWLSRRTDILDYDLLGRTRAQCLSPMNRAVDQELVFGEGLSGDAVTPISDDVQKRLVELITGLAAYGLDGLVLDHTSMYCGWAVGQVGHSPGMRAMFWDECRVDSLDVPPKGPMPINLGVSPLEPLVLASDSFTDRWAQFYRDKCDNLLDALLKIWSQAGEGRPVWLIDTLGSNNRSVHDWSRFKQTVTGLLVPITGGNAKPGSSHVAFKTVPLLRASEAGGTLLFAGMLAKAQGQKLDAEAIETPYNLLPTSEGIAIDLTCAGQKKADFLRLLLKDSDQE